MKTYSQLTKEQRYQISVLKKTGMTNPNIAKEIGVHRSTINRELTRNRGQRGYRPRQANELAQSRKKSRVYARIDESTWQEVDVFLQKEWSPEQISGRFKKLGKQISHETIYKYVLADKESGGSLYKHLRHQKKRRKRYGTYERRGSLTNRVSIDERPEEASNRNRLGDWEIDTMIGKNHHGALVTIVERKSRFTLIQRTINRRADVVAKTTINLLRPLLDQTHTITADNGKEFARHQQIADAVDADFYFAHPYSSWERGTNENTNGLIRQYFPKKTDFHDLDDKQVLDVQNKLNNRPRKSLGYLTPFEVLTNLHDVALTT